MSGRNSHPAFVVAVAGLAFVSPACHETARTSDAAKIEELEVRLAKLEARVAEMPAEASELESATIDELGLRVDSDDPLARWKAGRELGRRPHDGHAKLVELLTFGTTRQREAAGAALASSATRDDFSALLQAHRVATSDGMRALLATALGRTETSEAIDPLVKDLDDPSQRVKIAAILALGHLKKSPASLPLLKIAISGDAVLAPIARSTLGRLDPSSLVFITEAWPHFNPRDRESAIQALANVSGEKVDELLVTQLQDGSPRVALTAAVVLAQRGSQAGRTLAQNRLASDDPAVAGMARQVLDILGPVPE